MTATAASPVISGVGAHLPSAVGGVVSDPYAIYTLTFGSVWLIESVFVQVDYSDSPANGDTYILRLVDQTGLILYGYPTANFAIPGGPQLYLTWARGLADQTGTSGAVIEPGSGAFNIGMQAMPLPDVILRGGSEITLQVIRGASGDSTEVIILAPTITYTDMGSVGASGSAVLGIPLFTDTSP